MQTRTAQLAAGAEVDAQVPVRLSPRLARRAHAVSAALGRFHAPLAAQVPPIRPLRPFSPLRTRCRPMVPLRPCSHRRPRSRPHHRHPPLTDSASVAFRPTHECARSAATAPGGRPLVRPALPLRCSTRPPRPRSRLHRRSRRCILPPLAHIAGSRRSRCLQSSDTPIRRAAERAV